MEDKYTSLELSKALHEAGFEQEGRPVYWVKTVSGYIKLVDFVYEDKRTFERVHGTIQSQVKSYDILNDLCVKYAKEVFSRAVTGHGCSDLVYHTRMILSLLRSGKKQEAEDYIMKHSILFKKNNE